ncbi:MAG: hypothetical protein AAGH64_10920 [Planctomycetota bacterium]
MNRLMIVVAGCACAAPAFAQLGTDITLANRSAMILDASQYTLNSVSLEDGFAGTGDRSFTGTSYSNLTNAAEGFFSVGSDPADGDGAAQAFAFDDYLSVAPASAFLDTFGFVGGVDVDGGVLFFDFFDASGSFVDGFGMLTQIGCLCSTNLLLAKN